MNKWHTTDRDICTYADQNDLIVITKDADFRDSFLIKDTPKKLIKINLGNIPNKELIEIFESNLESIKRLNFNDKFLIEIDRSRLTYIVK